MLEGLEMIGQNLKLPIIFVPTDDAGAILIAEEAVTLPQWFLFTELRSDSPRSSDKLLIHALCKQLRVSCPQAILLSTSGAQFPVIEDSERSDVARTLYRDLIGQSVRRSQQTDGHVQAILAANLHAPKWFTDWFPLALPADSLNETPAAEDGPK
jgi:hypothetical protein